MPASMPTPFVGAQEDLVREHVELLLRFALNVGRPGGSEDIVDRPVGDPFRDGLASQRDVDDERGELAGRAGMPTPFFGQKLVEGRPVGQHRVYPGSAAHHDPASRSFKAGLAENRNASSAANSR